MSRADLEKWEARYAQVGSPEPVDAFLLEIEDELPRAGRALDIAGGTGRNAIFLARRGLDVTLVDISPTALEVAQRRAAHADVSITTVALDLEEVPLPKGFFDLITSTWFLLTRELWTQAVERLELNGRFVYVQPTTINLERHAHPSRRFLLEAGSLVGIVKALDLEVIRLEEGWDVRGYHSARLLAQRCCP
jgi:SAM-dependent methyltransferase